MPKDVIKVEKYCPFLTFPSRTSRPSGLKPKGCDTVVVSACSKAPFEASEAEFPHETNAAERSSRIEVKTISYLLILNFMGAKIHTICRV